MQQVCFSGVVLANNASGARHHRHIEVLE